MRCPLDFAGHYRRVVADIKAIEEMRQVFCARETTTYQLIIL